MKPIALALISACGVAAPFLHLHPDAADLAALAAPCISVNLADILCHAALF